MKDLFRESLYIQGIRVGVLVVLSFRCAFAMR